MDKPIHGSVKLKFHLSSPARRLSSLGLLLLLFSITGCQPEALPTPAVTLALLGDVMLGRAVHTSDQTFQVLAPSLQSADLALANLESPLTDAPVSNSEGYSLCAAPATVKYLVAAGLDLLSLANNHRLDCGENGLAETKSTLTRAGLGYLGPELQPVYRSINGLKLAFLALDATGNLDLKPALQAVATARQSGAVVIVSIHWGLEYQTGAAPQQKQIASQLADAGATLICGHHPHVLQPVEWLGSSKTLVLYSLGNALFDQAGLENTRQSALALVKLDTFGVQKISILPFLINVTGSRLVDADPASAKVIMDRLHLSPQDQVR
jgi:poly-gamma-glutamate synthesis protein (capsule biosynthesis protein)